MYDNAVRIVALANIVLSLGLLAVRVWFLGKEAREARRQSREHAARCMRELRAHYDRLFGEAAASGENPYLPREYRERLERMSSPQAGEAASNGPR